jgi:1,2-diacylglycerol 3-alpha-glucosyltransferase
LKIAIFSESYLPFLNGVSISIRVLRDELRRRGHEVWVYAPRFKGYDDNDPQVRRFPSLYTPFEREYPIAFPIAPTLWREWRSQKFDVVHTHTPFLTGITALRWCKRAHVPIVSTYHTLYEQYLHYVPPPFPKGFVRRLLLWHLRRYYRSVAQVMTPSEIGADMLRKYGVKTPITPIRNAVLPFPEISHEEARHQLAIPDDVFALLYVGRLAREKNLPLLIHSLPSIIRQFPNAHLWLVGDGPARSELQNTCSQLDIQDHVHFAGSLPRDQVSLYLLAADLFTFPSLTESQALVLDEAQAAGLASVVTNQGGSAEAIDYGETGLVVEPEQDAFTAAIARLVQDSELRRRFSEAGARKRETLSVPAVTDRVMQIYQSAMRTQEGTILVGNQP